MFYSYFLISAFYYQEFNIRLKRELEDQYEVWQDIIEGRLETLNTWSELLTIAATSKVYFEK